MAPTMKTFLGITGVAITLAVSVPPAGATNLAGTVTDPYGRAQPGLFVSVRSAADGITRSVVTDDEGVWRMLGVPPGGYTLTAHQIGYKPAVLEDQMVRGSDMTFDFEVNRLENIAGQVPASTIVSLLPEGGMKTRVILDCMGCHQFSGEFVTRSGRARTRDDWARVVAEKQGMFGPGSRYPVMSGTLDPDATADWLIEHLGGPGDETPALLPPVPLEGDARRIRVTEYPFPRSRDLPNALHLDRDGSVLVTGQITHALYRLDPEEGEFAVETIPVSVANPRGIEIDASGRRLVLLGFPQKIGVFDPADDAWAVTDLGHYPQSMALDPSGRAWLTFPFTRAPSLLGRFDPVTREVRTWGTPRERLDESAPGPFPEGVAAGADGSIWMTEMEAGRLLRFDPGTETFTAWPLPGEAPGPRRLAVGADGMVWIPEFTGNALTRFDPLAEAFTRYPLPRTGVLPYAAAVHPGTGHVWVAEAAGDALLRFDPVSETFTEFRLPHGSAYMREIAIDAGSGAIWTTSSPNPGTSPRVIRLEAR